MSQTPRRDLVAVLDRIGWRVQGSGPVGELWVDAEGRHEVGIPYEASPKHFEWDGILRRVAHACHQEEADLRRRVEWFSFDVTDFKVDGPTWRHSVPVEAGFSLFKTARQVLRTSATTARGHRAVIGSSYSKLGDKILSAARFGQTMEGSYIVPLMVPIDANVEDLREPQHELRQEDPVFRTEQLEPEARRVTRTMAESLEAISKYLVQPARLPKKSQIGDLVIAGVSRELVSTIIDVLERPSVSSFVTTFHWSEDKHLVKPPTEMSLDFPSGAREVLSEASRLFDDSKPPPFEVFTGPIVELRHEQDSPIGSIAIDTTRRGRRVEIVVPLGSDHLAHAHEWFRKRETLVVKGTVQRVSNRLRIDRPKEVGTLGDPQLEGMSAP